MSQNVAHRGKRGSEAPAFRRGERHRKTNIPDALQEQLFDYQFIDFRQGGWKLLIQNYSFLGISTDFRTGFSRHNRTHVL